MHNELRRIPDNMVLWNMRLKLAPKSLWDGDGGGKYVLVDVAQAGIEQHHQVELIDEESRPLPDVWVIFGYPGGGPDLSRLSPAENYWPNSPMVLRGNAQRTGIAGYVQHTFSSGGEDIWIWDVGPDGILKLPSAIVKNCTWTVPPVGWSNHTGVRIRFQRQLDGYVSEDEQLAILEFRVSQLEKQLGMK